MSGFYFLTHPNDYLKGGCNFYINCKMNNSTGFRQIPNLKRPCESAYRNESFSALNASIRPSNLKLLNPKVGCMWVRFQQQLNEKKIPAYSFINLLSIYCWRKPITLTIYVQLILTARQTRAGMAKIGVEGTVSVAQKLDSAPSKSSRALHCHLSRLLIDQIWRLFF